MYTESSVESLIIQEPVPIGWHVEWELNSMNAEFNKKNESHCHISYSSIYWNKGKTQF
jgi:hypothetical protein